VKVTWDGTDVNEQILGAEFTPFHPLNVIMNNANQASVSF
jgi:hypothetical protein